jgi:hypothetical protein
MTSSTVRLCLVPIRAGRAVLDGGWWPRSTDSAAELPDLIVALAERYGPIRQMMLNRHSWENRTRRLVVGPRVIRLGWFASLDSAMAVATTEHGEQIDLLVVPPDTAEAAARSAMARAADPNDTMRAPAILATIPAQATPSDHDVKERSAWDNEGGSQAANRPHRTSDSPSLLAPVVVSGLVSGAGGVAL